MRSRLCEFPERAMTATLKEKMPSRSPVRSGMRVRLLVSLPQPPRADVRINLRRRQAFVSQQFLDAAEVRSAVEEVGGEAVPERVRGGDSIETRHLEVLLQHAADTARCQPFAEAIQKQGEGFIARQLRVRYPPLQPMTQSAGGVAADGGDPLLASLTEHPHNVRVPVPVRHVERNQLRHPQPARIHRLQHRSIAQSLRRVCRWGFQESRDLLRRQKVRQLAADAGGSQCLGGVCLDQFLPTTEPEEGSQTGEPTGDRGSRVFAFMQIRNVPAQNRDRHIRRSGNVADAIGEIFEQTFEILVIGFQRQLGGIPLDAEIAEESFDGRVHGSTDGFYSK